MANHERADPLTEEVAEMAARVVRDELIEVGVMPLARLVHIIRAGIETYLIFSARRGAEGGSKEQRSGGRARRSKRCSNHSEEGR